MKFVDIQHIVNKILSEAAGKKKAFSQSDASSTASSTASSVASSLSSGTTSSLPAMGRKERYLQLVKLFKDPSKSKVRLPTVDELRLPCSIPQPRKTVEQKKEDMQSESDLKQYEYESSDASLHSGESILITHGAPKTDPALVKAYVERMRKTIAESYCGAGSSCDCSCCAYKSDSSTIATTEDTKSQERDFASQTVLKKESSDIAVAENTSKAPAANDPTCDDTVPCTESAKLRTQASPISSVCDRDSVLQGNVASCGAIKSSASAAGSVSDAKVSAKSPLEVCSSSSDVGLDASADASSANIQDAIPEIRPSVTLDESPVSTSTKKRISTTSATVEESPAAPVKKKRRVTALEDLGIHYGKNPDDMPEDERRKFELKCPHCGQKGVECFDEFFGPYCILAAAYHIQVEEYIPSPRECSNYYRHAFFHAVHFYCYLVTKCFDNCEMEDITPPECMLKGSFKYMLNDLRKAAVTVDEKRRDLQNDVIRSVMLFGKDYLLNEN